MLSLKWRRTFFSMRAGGGVHGKGAGTAHATIAQVGCTIEAFHLSMCGYLQVGGLITGSIVGEGIHGTTNGYPIISFGITGKAGKRAGIGKNKTPGVSRGWNPGNDPERSIDLERANRNPTKRLNRGKLERPNRDPMRRVNLWNPERANRDPTRRVNLWNPERANRNPTRRLNRGNPERANHNPTRAPRHPTNPSHMESLNERREIDGI
jgi:hypothetical protein